MHHTLMLPPRVLYLEERLRAVEEAVAALADAALEKRISAVEDAIRQERKERNSVKSSSQVEEFEELELPVLNQRGSPGPPSSRNERRSVTPLMLDCGDMYTISESVWDSMLFCGHSSIGLTNSVMMISIWFLNLILQFMFIVIIVYLMTQSVSLDAAVLDGLLKFRLGLAHRAEYADKVTQRSMAQQICDGDSKLHLAGEQTGLYTDLMEYVGGGVVAQCLVVFIQILWLCTILKDVDTTYSIFRAVCQCRMGSQTKLVVDDMDEHEDDSPPTLVRAGARDIAVGEDDSGHLYDFMKVVRMVTVWPGRVAFFFFSVCLPKLLVAGLLWWFGAKWLANTVNFSELILNGVALAFVLEFDEVLYSVLMPRRTKTLICNFKPLPMPPRKPGSRLSGVGTAFIIALVMTIILTFYMFVVLPINWQILQGEKIVCSGDLNFVYTENPATKMVHVAKTMGENVYTDIEEIIAQVSQVELQENDGWEGRVSQSIFDASRSTFARAVDESTFGLIVDMSVWSLSDAASTLPCRDLGSGQSTEASVQTLRVLRGDPNISSCDDIPRDLCAARESTWLRAICPRHCRCEEPLLSNVGFFGKASFGCPSQCETFKAATSEIAFRYALSTLESASRRLQAPESLGAALDFSILNRVLSAAQDSNATQNSSSDQLTTSSLFQGCSDFASAEFSFAGGCADSNEETQLDKNGNDCSVYAAVPSFCGMADDDDFQAADLCCACGGGREDVLSSASCWDNFESMCWHMPRNARAFLFYVRGLFEYLTSLSGFNDSVTEVVEKDYAGVNPDEGMMADLIEHVATGAMGRALVSGIWELMPGLAHPRGLSGCDFLASYEVTSLLNLDACADGDHTSLRFFCPKACGCGSSFGMDECPVACVLKECLEANASCAHVHPWYSDECLAGYHNDGGRPTCLSCAGGETRRRRAADCTDCPDGFYDIGNLDDCVSCVGGAVRRRRSQSCTDCAPGYVDAGDSDECSPCVGCTTTRRRSVFCAECATGRYNEGGMEDDCQLCLGVWTTRRRASTASECPAGHYNDGTSDDCLQCGRDRETRRRRAETCTTCDAGYTNLDGDDTCEPVGCPYNSTGDSVVDGCKCDVGFVGLIRPLSGQPYFSGACSELPFYKITSGFCPVPVLDTDLCPFAAQVLGMSDATSATERNTYFDWNWWAYLSYEWEPRGCYVDTWFGNLLSNEYGEQFCSPRYACICIGYEDEFVCTDSGDTTCPNATNASFSAYYDCSDGVRESCCDCGGGDLTKQSASSCVDTDGLHLSVPAEFSFENGQGSSLQCLKWDWMPSTCHWAIYYDEEEFTAADMCCACGGGQYAITLTAASSTTTTSATESNATQL
ncbi:unnamed protein product [Prorocentrum cordatum]|uniref:Uncharacterized protein n=2 Tax=Prorocentrum cordatum TaxID=2364126 RepID=A0ABN9S779_9DINO|nr:unnamed protein product [Polarella glacialis]